MRNIFVTIKKKWILAFIAVVLIVPLFLSLFASRNVSMPKPEYTIVIDAGHGGLDVK